MSGSLQSSGNVTNIASQNQDFTISTRAQLYEGSLGIGSPNVLPDNFSIFASFGLIGEQIYKDLSPNTLTPFGPFDANSGSLTVFSTTDPGELAWFEGFGKQFGYDFNTQILTSILGGGGNVFNSIETLASAAITVKYDYTPTTMPKPIPEPATMTLLGLGLAGLSFTCRRKLKKSNLSGDR